MALATMHASLSIMISVGATKSALAARVRVPCGKPTSANNHRQNTEQKRQRPSDQTNTPVPGNGGLMDEVLL